MRASHRVFRSLLAVALPLACSSCFTMLLWGFEPSDDVDPVTGEEVGCFEYDPDTKWSWGDLGGRVLLTPVTLLLDCVTAPVQCWMFFDGGEDDGSCGCRNR
jgi:hypothetical protein